MFCDHCGAQLQDGQGFCHSCGKSFQAGAPPVTRLAPPRNRVTKHLTVLGILWVAWSVLHLVPAIGTMFVGSFWMPFIHNIRPAFFVGPMVTAFGGLMGLCAIFGIIAGWALIARQSWARIALLILACFSLLNLPLGTALGVYTLWVLLPSESEREFRRLADAR